MPPDPLSAAGVPVRKSKRGKGSPGACQHAIAKCLLGRVGRNAANKVVAMHRKSIGLACRKDATPLDKSLAVMLTLGTLRHTHRHVALALAAALHSLAELDCNHDYDNEARDFAAGDPVAFKVASSFGARLRAGNQSAESLKWVARAYTERHLACSSVDDVN